MYCDLFLCYSCIETYDRNTPSEISWNVLPLFLLHPVLTKLQLIKKLLVLNMLPILGSLILSKLNLS